MDINREVNIMVQTRKNVMKILSEYSIEEMNVIPDGFNNNLLWNFGHMLITQELLCYKLSGQKMTIDDHLIAKYKGGSIPESSISHEEYEQLKQLSEITSLQLITDYNKGIFSNYNDYTLRYGITLHNIDEAVMFNNLHEAHHYGYCLALRKLI